MTNNTDDLKQVKHEINSLEYQSAAQLEINRLCRNRICDLEDLVKAHIDAYNENVQFSQLVIEKSNKNTKLSNTQFKMIAKNFKDQQKVIDRLRRNQSDSCLIILFIFLLWVYVFYTQLNFLNRFK